MKKWMPYLLLLILAACRAKDEPVIPPAPAAKTSWNVVIDDGVPALLRQEVVAFAKEEGLVILSPSAGISPDITITAHKGKPIADWLYAVVAPFASVQEEITLAELQNAGIVFANPQTTQALKSILPNLTPVPQAQLSIRIWEERALAIIPFEQLTADLKTLRLEGYDVLQPGLQREGYPLQITFGVDGPEEARLDFTARWDFPTPVNRNERKLTRVAVSGVTALVRATAAGMEAHTVTWPGEEVAAVMAAADITHISNEIAFAPDCPFPNAFSQSTIFCSRDDYFGLIKMLGVDVVELTGNHINDWGRENLVRTIGMYENAGISYFGGGVNLKAAKQPALFEHNGNHIAFVGCNVPGPQGAWAGSGEAGANPCPDLAAFGGEIAGIAAQNQFVIATLQYHEHYDYFPTSQMKVDFERVAVAGADVVSGSQAHHAHGFDFAAGAFIHYGPGNLFFDQMFSFGTRQTVVATYTIYENRLLGVELWTGLIEEFARPRQMTPQERADFLQLLFQASGW